MKILIALGGNALLRRGEDMTADNQRHNIEVACQAVAKVGRDHELIIGHGNGPQVGLLALQAAAYADEVSPYPFDILGAESQGMIGYMLEQELRKQIPGKEISCLLTQTVVDPNDPAVKNPSKFIGKVYTKEEADELLVKEPGWTIKPDGQYYRRVVPSPEPKAIVEIETLRKLVNGGVIVIAGGGGGIPITGEGGFEAVIDKDLCCSLMARELDVDYLVIATSVDAVFTNYGKPNSLAIKAAHPAALQRFDFPAGSMGPKIRAACQFVQATGNRAVIGSLYDIEDLVANNVGTLVSTDVEGVVYYEEEELKTGS